MFYITVPVRGHEFVWFIGDEFTTSSFDDYYKSNTYNGKPMTYVFENFQVEGYFSSKHDYNTSCLCRLRNNLVHALNAYDVTPKVIVVVIDGDLLRNVQTTDELTATIQIGKMIEWLIREYWRILESYRDNLPIKAKKENCPYVVWIAPPSHKYFGNLRNFKRERLGHCMDTVMKNYEFMSVLQLIKVWNPDDGSAVLYDGTRYTSQGLTNYWLAVDSAVRYWNVALHPKFQKDASKQIIKTPFVKNKYKWQRKT